MIRTMIDHLQLTDLSLGMNVNAELYKDSLDT